MTAPVHHEEVKHLTIHPLNSPATGIKQRRLSVKVRILLAAVLRGPRKVRSDVAGPADSGSRRLPGQKLKSSQAKNVM